jgi:Mrp family chromosome partitioning ATPase
LAVVGILSVDYINNTIETSEQIINLAPVPVISINDNRSLFHNMFHNRQLRAERSQKYQMLGMRLLYTSGGVYERKMVVVAPTDDHGDSGLVASQIALFLAKTGKRVMLVDGNAEQPTVANYYHLGNRPGLSDFITNNPRRPMPIIAIDRIPNLGLLPFGNTQVDSSFLATPPVLAQFERLNERADIVLVAVPNLHRSDALMLTTHARGVILVITRGKTTQKALSEVVESLSMVSSKILAAVLKQAHLPGENQDIPKIKGTIIGQPELPPSRTPAGDGVDKDEVGSSMLP